MLTVENLTVCYGESQILQNISLNVAKGEIVCLMGRNGVGKTTLLKAIMGLLKAKSGKIYLDDVELSKYPAYQRARLGIGYVPQGRGIFPHLSVLENLLMGFEAVPTQREHKETLEENYAIFPVLKQMRGRLAGTLSGGQQQQLAIARALMQRPSLILLDEPTEGIQPSIVDEIENLLNALKSRGDIAILVIEQFLDFALSVASSYYIMEKGDIVANGPVNLLNQQIISEYLAV